MSSILILIMIAAASALPYGYGGDTILSSEMGLQPEVLVTAPRLEEEQGDSIGMMPGIIVFGERYQPENERNLIVSYQNFRNVYNAISHFLVRYGVYLAVGIATITWGVIAYARYHTYAHAPATHHPKDKESALHKYYKRCQRNKEQYYVL